MYKKKLSYYIENYGYGGLEKFVKDCLANAIASNYEVTFYCNASNVMFINELKRSGLGERITIKPVNVLYLGHARYHVTGFNKKMGQLFFSALILLAKYPLFIYNFLYLCSRIKQAEIFHAINGGYPGTDSCRAAVLVAKIKKSTVIVMSVLSISRSRRWYLAIFELFIDSMVGKAVTYFHVNSMAARDALISKRGFSALKIVNIYTGIDTSAPLVKKTVKQNTHMNIGTISALMPLKGHVYLIEAAKLVQERYGRSRTFKYLIIGGGGYQKRLEELASALNVRDSFCFCGRHPDSVDAILSDIDIFVFPSLQESFPYAILEAMASGLPIIASNVGGIPEQIVDRETGLLIPPSDSRAIADSIIWLLDNPELMLKYGHFARNRVKEFFDIAIFRKKINELYDGAALKRWQINES